MTVLETCRVFACARAPLEGMYSPKIAALPRPARDGGGPPSAGSGLFSP